MSHKTNPEATCGTCQNVIDAAAAIEGDHKPSENDITICIYCGSISQFNKDFSLRPVEQDFLDKLKEEDNETFNMLSQASAHIKKERSKKDD